MINVALRFSRAATTAARTARLGLLLLHRPSFLSPPPPSSSYSLRLLHDGITGSNANPVSLQMINYALSHARSQKSDDSYAQGLLVLEQCLSTHSNEGEDTASENSRGMVLLAMSTLLSERGNLDEAMDKLQIIQDLTHSSLGVRVAAMEALIGLHLELGQDDTSSVLADKCLQLLGKNGPESGYDSEVLNAQAKAAKGLVELVHGNLETAGSLFQGAENGKCCAATCALGQLEGHMGNFGDAEEILTRALTNAEEYFGTHHPKVGVVLTCIALMFRQKAMLEHSSALVIQEGLYRKALDLLKAPPLENEGAEAKMARRDIVALARGGYADVLCVQQNRKDEGDRMKSWAETFWRNRRLSLVEALEVPKASSKVPVIDARIGRTL